MPKINVYLPDDLADSVRDTGVPVSAVCQRALEVAVQRIRAVRDTAAGELTPETLAERLPAATERTRAVLILAIDQARESGAATVTSGHLLRGMIAEGRNMALRVLEALEITPARLAEAPITDEPGEGPGLRFSASAAAAIELAVAESTALGHNFLGNEHLLIGLTAEPEGAAGRILREAGTDARTLRRAVNAALAGFAHLRASTTSPAATTALLTAVRQELQPLITRIERLEAGRAADGN